MTDIDFSKIKGPPLRIEWELISQAFALLGYEFKLDDAFLKQPSSIQLMMWGAFIAGYTDCHLQCAWKGGGPCLRDDCPRSVLRQVSLSPLPLDVDPFGRHGLKK